MPGRARRGCASVPCSTGKASSSASIRRSGSRPPRSRATNASWNRCASSGNTITRARARWTTSSPGISNASAVPKSGTSRPRATNVSSTGVRHEPRRQEPAMSQPPSPRVRQRAHPSDPCKSMHAMTTHAVGSLSSVPAASKGAPGATAPAPAAAAPFEHQLHAARQRSGPATPDHAPDHGQRPGRNPDSGDRRSRDPSPSGSHARHLDASATRLDQRRADAPDNSDPPSTVPSAPAPAAKTTVALAASTALPPPVQAVTGAASHEAEPVERAADGGIAVQPQGDAAAGLALTTGMAPATMPAQWLAADGLSPGSGSARDPARADAAPALGLSAPATTAPAAPVSVPIAVPAGSHAFAQELGQQVSWFVGQDVKQARIRLHPEELGSLDLKISVNHGRVDVVFHAQHPAAVTAVQQSLPQLDHMLARHGLSLGHTEVGQHDRGDQSGYGGHGDNASEIDEIPGPSLVTPLSQSGLLDAFA